jgi:site-specific DNA-methyltransferase (adenine-specific)
MDNGKVVHGDCLEVMEDMGEDSIDLIISDPPYNASHGNNAEYEEKNWEKLDEDWDSFTKDDYFSFTQKWIKKAKRVLKDGGSIFVFGSYHNIGFVNITFQKLNMDMLNEIIWYKRDAFPNIACTRLTASHESILWAYKGNDKNYTFNYDWIKETKYEKDSFDEADTQVRTVWNIPKSKPKDETTHHPTQKPLSVVDRLVQMASEEGDIILDPFAGSGTTLVSAKAHGRDYIGIEKESEYVEMCRSRLEQTRVEEENEDSLFDY